MEGAMQGVYEIINLENGKSYVGSSTNIERRWGQHRCALRAGRHDNAHLQRAFDKYGEEAFEFSVIEKVADVDKLLEREQCWLNRYLENPDTCYNIATTAGPVGPRPEETKRKISKANKGQVPWNKGKRGVYSDKTLREISEAAKGREPWNKGRPRTEEARQNIGAALVGNQNSLGHQHTEGAKRKMSEAKGKPYPAFIHQETGEVIPAGVNLRKLCQERGLSQGSMWKVMHSKRRSRGGWAVL